MHWDFLRMVIKYAKSLAFFVWNQFYRAYLGK